MSSYKQRKLLSLIAASILPMTLLCSCASSLAEKEKEFEQRKADWEALNDSKGKVVYAIKDIPEGGTINEEQLEEKEISATKIPQDALTSASLCVGRNAKYGISQGQIVSQHDLAPQGASASTALVLPLSEEARKKLDDLAKSKNTTAPELAKQLLEEKLNSISK